MGLAAGSRLGPYEILAPLGAGGMGEVYRARDGRLGREVALKVLPASVSSDPERVKRFEQEARSASRLNHPNIVTVHDAGESEGVAYLAMELVAGLTLRELPADGPLPKRILAIAAQAADGLAKAHEAGIVHRDLKPENVMVTKDGFAKILDFGLAKLTQPEDPSAATHAPTLSAGTAPGIVMGTVGYMSPEQAQGRPLDFRSDQFSLGSILYEMATGRRAFARGSTPETMAAIIREEPEAIGALVPAVPVPLRWIVERCLAKSPSERYDSTRDLARDLARLRDGLSEASVTGPSPATRAAGASRRRWAIVLVLGLAAGAAVGAVAARSIRRAPADWRLVTFGRGAVGRARFSPDGETILYGAAWEGKPVQLYSTRLDSAESTALPLPSARLVSVSSTGKLAIALARESPVLAEVPLAGGSPREILEGVEFADWAPGSETLAVIRDSRLELPVGKVLYDPPGRELSYPRFSPTGDAIALLETLFTPGSTATSIVMVNLDGTHKTLSTGWEYASSLVWNPRTDEVWFSAREVAGQFGGLALHAVSRSGRHRVVARGPDLLFAHDISRDGRVLLTQAEWRTSMMCRPAGATREVDLSWLDYSTAADLSEDGRTILFDEGGIAAGAKGAVYLRATDGSAPAVRLGEGAALALSPDKKWAISVPTGAPDRLVLLPTGAGEAKVFREPGTLYRNAVWFPDGKRMVVEAGAPGRRRLYVQDLAGGALRGLTPEGFFIGPVSPDGKLVAALSRADGKVVLYPTEGGEPRTVPGIGPNEGVVGWDAGGGALLLGTSVLPIRIERFDLGTGKRQLLQEIAPADPTGVAGVDIDGVGGVRSVVATSDGRSYAYTLQRTLGRLFVVTGLE